MAADIAALLKDWSMTLGNNLPYGTTFISTNLNDNLQQIQVVVRALASRSTIASAATCDIGSIQQGILTVTGTATISSLGSYPGSNGEGIYRTLVFGGALTLVNSSSLILPGGRDIVTRAGDCALFVYEGSGAWRCLSYLRSDFRALAGYGLVVLGTTGAVTMDFSLGDNFLLIPTGNVTLSFTNPLPAGNVSPSMLWIEMGATPYTVGFPASVRWPGGVTPALSGASKMDIISFVTRDAGVKHYGSVVGKGYTP